MDMEQWKCPCTFVIPQNIPRTFRNPAEIILKCIKLEIVNNTQTILEAGSGCLRNATYLLNEGYDVSVVELTPVIKKYKKIYESFKKEGGKVYENFFPSQVFDVILSTFTIETICPFEKRLSFIKNINTCLKQNGCLLLSVRNAKDVLTSKKNGKGLRCPMPGDGYLTPNGTFIKPFTVFELKTFLESNGFKIEHIFRKSEKIEPRKMKFISTLK